MKSIIPLMENEKGIKILRTDRERQTQETEKMESTYRMILALKRGYSSSPFLPLPCYFLKSTAPCLYRLTSMTSNGTYRL